MNFNRKPSREDNEEAAQRVLERTIELSKYTDVCGHITRAFLSASTKGVHDRLRDWMAHLGMQVRVDAMGNLRGVYPAQDNQSGRLLIGSHIDTVPCAGAYDGVLGVMLGLALIELLKGRRLAFEVEILAFSEEEGIRFRTPFLGSRALVGQVDDQLLRLVDSDGTTLRQAIQNFGLDPERMHEALIQGRAFGYIEFHIEQGPVLEERGLGLGLVEDIVGQSRLELSLRGMSGHAGTTPMHSRRDALAAAAEFVLAAERNARTTPGLVVTVGQLCAYPGAANVIPGEVKMSLDVRHSDNVARTSAVEAVLCECRTIAARRGISLEVFTRLEQKSVMMDASLTAALAAATSAAGYPVYRMSSGAGHDAMIIAQQIPVAMLFLRSPGGISHHPQESVLKGDVIAAIEAGLYFLNGLDDSLAGVGAI